MFTFTWLQQAPSEFAPDFHLVIKTVRVPATRVKRCELVFAINLVSTVFRCWVNRRRWTDGVRRTGHYPLSPRYTEGRRSFWCWFDINPPTFQEDRLCAKKRFLLSFPVTLISTIKYELSVVFQWWVNERFVTDREIHIVRRMSAREMYSTIV